MSTAIEDVRAALVADAGVTALVATRIYPQKAPQGGAQPFVVVSIVSDVPQYSHDNTVADRLTNARVQIDAYAAGYLTAHQIADAIDAALEALPVDGIRVVRINKLDLYDDTTELHRVLVEFSVWR